MTWDTLFHQGQDAFRKENGKLPKYLYAGNDERALHNKYLHDNKEGRTTYAGVLVIWAHEKTYFKFHL